jgi:hypothetical protein
VTDIASVKDIARTGDVFDGMNVDADGRAEMRGWVALATGSLAIAGVFALLVAMSRIPRIAGVMPWMADFFSRGLVIHVVFSFVVWFLTVFALMATLASYRIAAPAPPRLAWAGQVGRALVSLSFPFLLVPAFFRSTEASLNNYVPAIDHPYYLGGLVLLFIGILFPAIRLAATVRARKAPLDGLSFAATAGIFVYVVALVCIALAARGADKSQGAYGFFEHLFWGGGHVLQFLNVIMLIGGWFALGGKVLGEDPIDSTVFRIAVLLLAFAVVPTPVFYFAFAKNPQKLTSVFIALQYGLGPPALIATVAMLITARRVRRANGQGWPWRNLNFLAIALSILVFAIGGAFGFLVDGHDTRTPAHYHGVIAGVNLVMMGLFLTVFLPAIGRGVNAGARNIRAQVMLFGFGQAAACVGLFWAGGYGAPRKVAGYSGTLVDGAVVGMYLNGIGALVAIIGGVMFIWTVLAAVLRRSGGDAPAPGVAEVGPATKEEGAASSGRGGVRTVLTVAILVAATAITTAAALRRGDRFGDQSGFLIGELADRGPAAPTSIVTTRVASAQSSLMLIYVGADDCAPCKVWQRDRIGEVAKFERVKFREVKSPALLDVMKDANWPEDLRPFRSRIMKGAAVPLWLVVLDDEIVVQSFGLAQWDKTIVPYLRGLSR